ncbi:MAG: hypothetical protein ACOC80_16690 [Petrotogales bacterium]
MSEMISGRIRKENSTISRVISFFTRDICSVPITRVFVALFILTLFLYVAGFTINSGPSMNHLGWIYLTDWESLPQVGQVFRFTPVENPSWYKYLPRKTQIKRCVGITNDGRYIYEGDNQDWSEDNRDDFKPVPKEHVSGVITSVLHPRQIINWFNGGKKKRDVLRYAPDSVWSHDRQYFALISDSVTSPNSEQLIVSIYSKDGEKIWEDDNFWLKSSETKPEWERNHFIYPTNEDWVYGSFNPYSCEYKTFVEKPSEITILYKGKHKLILMGDCRSLVKAGDKLEGERVAKVEYPWIDNEVFIPIDERKNTLVLLTN